MGGFLRQATASQSRALGPFIDDTDFKTPATGLTIANTDIKLVVNGGASANKNSGGGTHRVNGVYGVTFDATDTATVGEMEVSVLVSGALIVFDKFTIVEEAVYDRDYAASSLGYVANAPVNVAQFGGSNGTFNSGIPDVRLADAVSHGGTLGSSTATLALSRMSVTSQTANQAALTLQGNGTREGLRVLGGATGEGIGIVGGGTSGDGVRVTTTDGHGLNLAPAGNSKHGILATGGNSGTSDGLKAVAGNAGVDIRGAITGNITGNLSGSVGSVTAAVSANVTQFGGTNGTFASGRPEVNATHVSGSAVSTTVAQIGVAVISVATDAITSTAVSSAAVTKIQTGLATPTNITAGTITTVTNLTNAPTNGDLTATMKASVNTEVDTALADVGLTTTVTGRIDAAVSSRLASASYTAPLDAAGTRAAIGLASANLDTQIAALPTDSDVQTAAGAAITAAEPIDADIKRINGTVVNGDGGSTPWGP